MWVSAVFFLLQLTGAILSNSIAIFTGCAQMAADMMSFVMAMVILKMTLKYPAKKQARAEAIGTLASMMFLIIIFLQLLISAINRVIDPQPVDGLKMLITAAFTLCFNVVQIQYLHQGDIDFHPGGKIGGDHDHSHGEVGHHHHEGGESVSKIADSATADDYHHDSHGGGGHHHDHSHSHQAKRNTNLDAAFLHALGNMMLNILVLIAAGIIYGLGKP